MECLGVPIDLRLRRVFRELLYSFRSSLEVDKSDYPICHLSFGLEIARPELKGGVFIKNSDGLVEGKRNCRTINVVSDLFSAINNAKLGFNDISDVIDDAHNVFADIARAKVPDILCCFITKTRNPLSRGLGRSFYPNNLKLTGFGFSSTHVNVFHPSYAINNYPISYCFKQLLVLEFTKAFAL
ncbi:hypothetical protein N7499_001064 [Penicillium canescens]|nr:hypothetical protein N7522_003905 [Penicillium canescens]KAJ6019767.1 hypothetical protein N7522_000475 [Penicillium canescens]KAJ6093809.1 hypothetical protein N7499_003140 [Penicillium canescens]KAJ6101434.1 hypothetical protein N7499_001064 [Penicillium canescens]